MDDALAKLADEHEKVREMASRLEDATAAGDVEAATELTREITDGLNALTAVEHEALFPAVVELSPELKPQVDAAIGEHLVAKELLYAARSSEPLPGDMPETALVAEAVHHHLADEELIGIAREAAGKVQLEQAVLEKTATLEEAGAAGHAIKEQEDQDLAGESERTGGPDLSATAARVRNQ